TENIALACRLAAGPDFWTVVRRVPEGYEWLERIRTLGGGEAFDGPDSVVVYFGLTLCAIQSGRSEDAFQLGRRDEELAARYGMPVIAGRALITRGHVALSRGEVNAAAEFFDQACASLAAAGSEAGAGRARIFFAFALLELG